MEWWKAGLWGLAGGAAIELVDLYKLIRTSDGSYSLPRGGSDFWLAYAIAVAIRLVLGFLAAYTLQQADQLDGALAALGTGAGATGFVEHVSRGARPPRSDEGAEPAVLSS
jgi:hypothetical protein